MRITLAENFRAVFYAPYYALKSLGLAEREGLDVAWLPPGSPGGAIDDVKRGTVDLTWGGPMRVMRDHDTTPADGASLLCFGEVVARDPFCLVGRPDPAQFRLADLAHLRLGLVSEVPTPWQCLQADLRAADCDINAIPVTWGLTMEAQLQALKDGTLDVAQLFEPFVSQSITERAGALLYTAARRGPTVYTTFICSRAGMAARGAAFAALDRALQHLLDWMDSEGPGELARVTAAYFPDIPADQFRASVERYCAEGVWARKTEVSRAGFDRLAASLLSGGFIASPMSYDACVHRFEPTSPRTPGDPNETD